MPTSFHGEIPLFLHLPSPTIPPGLLRTFRGHLLPPLSVDAASTLKGLIWGVIPKSESEPPHAFPEEKESPEGLAESPPLRSRVGDGAALPDPASPGILQQKGATEEFFSSFFKRV